MDSLLEYFEGKPTEDALLGELCGNPRDAFRVVCKALDSFERSLKPESWPPSIWTELFDLLTEKTITTPVKQWDWFSVTLEDMKNPSHEQNATNRASGLESNWLVVMRCILKKNVFVAFRLQPPKQNQQLLILASKDGHTKLVKIIVELLQSRFEDPGSLPKEAENKTSLDFLNCHDNSRNTPLSIAAANGHTGIIEILLEAAPALADSYAMGSAVKNGRHESVEAILKSNFKLANTKNLGSAIYHAIDAVNDAKALKRDPRDYRRSVERIIQTARGCGLTGFISYSSIRHIIEKAPDGEGMALWMICKDECRRIYGQKNCDLLHQAVKYRRVEIVKDIAEDPEYGPELAVELDSGAVQKFPLWYNTLSPEDPSLKEICKHFEDRIKNINFESRTSDDEKCRRVALKEREKEKALDKIRKAAEKKIEEINEILKPAIIRAGTVFQSRMIFNDSNVKVGLICLNLANFDTRKHNFAAYAAGLREYGDSLDFEPVLRYANFPDLEYCSTLETYRQDNNEVGEILKWLKEKDTKDKSSKKRKPVTEILELTVLDRLNSPHEDEIVEDAVKSFSVQTLNWRKLDLCLTELSCGAPDRQCSIKTDRQCSIETLHLYSSGNKAVIKQWLSAKGSGGLRDMHKLKYLYIHLVKDVMSDNRAQSVEKNLRAELKLIKEEEKKGSWKDPIVQPCIWRQALPEPQRKSLEDIGAAAVPRLAKFINAYKLLVAQRQLESQPEISEEMPNETMESNDQIGLAENGIFDDQLSDNDDDFFITSDGGLMTPPEADELDSPSASIEDLKEIPKGYKNIGRNSTKDSWKSQGSNGTANGAKTHSEKLLNGTSLPAGQLSKLWKAKVAIIDCGIVFVGNKLSPAQNPDHIPGTETRSHEIESNLSSHIKEGASFVYSRGIEQPWWNATAAHGTQMASLICAIDPGCELYIAKVGETTTSGVTAERVTEAIRWAMSRDVDIISLSLVVLQKITTPLTNAINDAITQGIVIICSTADDGNNKTPSAISQHSDTIAIAACDNGGKPLDFTVEEGYQYLVPGKDIIAGAVPFVESNESISGSSAATAIAAGLASLTLSCLHLADNEKVKLEKSTRWAKDEVQDRFDRMARADHNGSGVYVKPWLFCGQEPDKTYTVDKGVDIPSVEALIKGCFNGKSMFEKQ